MHLLHSTKSVNSWPIFFVRFYFCFCYSSRKDKTMKHPSKYIVEQIFATSFFEYIQYTTDKIFNNKS